MENTLQHYGVLGMKWGVRRSPAQLGRKKYAKKEKSVSNKKEKRKLSAKSKKTVKDWTDDELRAKINRLELEKKYRDLLKAENAPKVSKGKAFVSDILDKSGKNIGTQLTTYALGTAVNKMLKTNAVNPKKGQKDK